MLTLTPSTLDELLSGSPYVSYAYSYPHKTAYRPLDPISLESVWADEDVSSLSLYVHIPFCEYRCGFCNLFTTAQPSADLPTRYLNAIERQIDATAAAIPAARYAQLAIGGGTPTFLSTAELRRLFHLLKSRLHIDPQFTPTGIEASPSTLDAEKLAYLREIGVERISLGIQSFSAADAGAMGRPQQPGEVERALAAVKKFDFPTVNLDLIYGGRGQTQASWLSSVREAVANGPEEIYLYPLYVRPLTGLGNRGELAADWDQQRLQMYRAGRDELLSVGYRQVSMRMFQRPGNATSPSTYQCQVDGMVGLGCGARSYTRRLHFSREYAVGSQEISSILAEYCKQSTADFHQVDYGFELDDEEQRRRYLILTFLQADGLPTTDYQEQFGHDPEDEFPELIALETRGLARQTAGCWQLTDEGLAWSDAIGPWLYSEAVRRRMEVYQCR